MGGEHFISRCFGTQAMGAVPLDVKTNATAIKTTKTAVELPVPIEPTQARAKPSSSSTVCGAIVLGSMSNYRDEQNAQQLANRGFRYFMVMGGYDDNKGAMYSALDLDEHNIAYHYEEVSNAGHGDLPAQVQGNLLLSAMDYVLAAF